MLRCGNCGNGVTAEEKSKQLRDGTIRKYVYYHCSRFDQTCKQPYVREDELLAQLLALIDQIDLDKTGMRKKLETEVEKMNKFTADVLGMESEIKIPKMDVRGYAKYVLKNGRAEEKRELLSCLRADSFLQMGNYRCFNEVCNNHFMKILITGGAGFFGDYFEESRSEQWTLMCEYRLAARRIHASGFHRNSGGYSQ